MIKTAKAITIPLNGDHAWELKKALVEAKMETEILKGRSASSPRKTE